MNKESLTNWEDIKERMGEAYGNWVTQVDVPPEEQTYKNFMLWAIYHLLYTEARRAVVGQAIGDALEEHIVFDHTFDPKKAT